jgi:hypothetical protein
MEVNMSPRAILIVLTGLLAIASPACSQASTPSPQTRSTAVYATVTARAKLAAAASTDRARATAAAATERAPVTATARAISAATAIATAAPKITARVATATARAARANPTGTARAISAGATATSAGILVSAPSEVKWYWDGERRKWIWEIEFREVAGRKITVTKRDTDVYPVDGGHYVDSGSHTINMEIAAYGSGKDDYWIWAAVGSEFHDATCILTYQVVDEKGSEISVQVVAKLKDEEK